MFFDGDNIYFDKHKEINNDINMYINNIDRSTTLQNDEDGFNKGNIFKNIYSKYKNHVYKLKVNTKRDELLYKIQMYTFILKDLNLYLDIHPNDEKIFKEFTNVKRKLESYKTKYEEEYGPLCINSTSDNKYDYLIGPWPWDKGDKNV